MSQASEGAPSASATSASATSASATSASAPSASATANSAAVLARLDTIVARLDALEARLAPVEALVQEVPHAVATAIDTLDATVAARPELPEGLARLMGAVERVSQPDTMAALNKALDVLEGAEGMVATSIDVIDERLTRISDMHERIEAVERLLITFTQPGHLDTLCKVANASMHGAAGEAEPMTPWAAFKASREPEVQRALGIAINVARALGAEHGHPLLAPAKPA